MKRLALALLAGTAVCSLAAPSANAFTIFGYKFFESESPEEQVLDPVRYSVTLDVAGGDDDLKETLENASQLVADKDNPVSGDLGVAIKARDDRDRLLATLYEQARYGAVVTVTVNGQDLTDLPPNPVFNHSSPVPVRVTVDPGPVFTLGQVTFAGDAGRYDPAEYDLAPGGNAGSLVIIKAAERVVNALKEEGRPLARLVARDLSLIHI